MRGPVAPPPVSSSQASGTLRKSYKLSASAVSSRIKYKDKKKQKTTKPHKKPTTLPSQPSCLIAARG
ncbi:hypothetical protein EKPV-NSW-ORF170 [Eastern grey kangaroopox virus]|uniref:Uncharacterized protein n=1 Tax=Eastern grey kangaroopox virus TaxID=2042482 RepID=A0A345Z0R8_9POXV|nr:hypothetical protein EKPV-NSW-ORF170 [Eastern grey kangaroopox virus]